LKHTENLEANDEQRLRNPRKSTRNVSNQLKTLVRSFSVIRDFLAWKVGSRKRVRLGIDVVMDCRDRFLLTKDSIDSIKTIFLY
jgi:hypothetical protein